MSKEFAKIITANRLQDGAVVFLTSEGAWAESTQAAAVARTPDDETRLLTLAAASVKACRVVDPNAIDVSALNTREPARLRERIRQVGPTVRPDLARAI
ncbi:MAG: DUF2849 domain-containing protein [Rhodospirillaceae bacterium]|nr:DUF2849 domain-containing protein [Rhodospirillaceae bacterium]